MALLKKKAHELFCGASSELDAHIRRQLVVAREFRRREISDLAEELGMVPEHLAAGEAGERSFSRAEANAIAAALGIRFEALTDGFSEPAPRWISATKSKSVSRAFCALLRHSFGSRRAHRPKELSAYRCTIAIACG